MMSWILNRLKRVSVGEMLVLLLLGWNAYLVWVIAVPNSIHVAVARGNARMVGHLAKVPGLVNALSGADFDMMDVAPLHVAAIGGRADISKLLLDCGADIDQPVGPSGVYAGMTALELATAFGKVDEVKCLMAAGAKRDRPDAETLQEARERAEAKSGR